MSWYSIPTLFACFQMRTQSMKHCEHSEGSCAESPDPKGAGARHPPRPDPNNVLKELLSQPSDDACLLCIDSLGQGASSNRSARMALHDDRYTATYVQRQRIE
jgi:hypothetical protein